MRRWLSSLAAAFILTGAQVGAQANDTLSFGGDAYLGGMTVVLGEPGADSIFMAGDSVEQASAITGSAHLAGRRIVIGAAVGENLYAIGANIRVMAPVAGDATLAAETVSISAAVGGNLRATGGNVDLTGPVAGAAMLAGRDIGISSAISGDVSITAETLRFGEGARIDGTLYLQETSAGALNVPVSVIPPERIRRSLIDSTPPGDMPSVLAPRDWRAIALQTAMAMLVVAVIVGLAATLLPRTMARLRVRIASHPFGAIGWGFLTLSALIGSVVVMGLTLIGLVLAPVAILLAVLTGFAGYVVGVWTLGAGLFTRFGNVGEPDTLGESLLSSVIGTVLVGLLALLPWVGWLIVLGIVLAGAGAILLGMFRPAFYARD